MPQFEWDPKLETGHAEIDTQHQALYALANALHDAIDAGAGAEAIDDAVYALTDYVLEHFRDEEALMAGCAYPALGMHKGMHERLTGETLRITASYFAGDDDVPDKLAPLIAQWLTEHIQKEDRTFVAFRREYESRE